MRTVMFLQEVRFGASATAMWKQFILPYFCLLFLFYDCLPFRKIIIYPLCVYSSTVRILILWLRPSIGGINLCLLLHISIHCLSVFFKLHLCCIVLFCTFTTIYYLHNTPGSVYRVSQEEWTKLRESVPYVKLYRYNPKNLYPKLNGYGDNGHRKVWASGVSTYCTPSVTPYSSSAHAWQRDNAS